MAVAELERDAEETIQEEVIQDAPQVNITESAGIVRAEYMAIKLNRSGVPMRQKTFNDKQKEKAASVFGAYGGAVSMSKKLFNAKIPEVKNFRAVLSDINRLVSNPDYTLPCPGEPGVRLMKKGMVAVADLELRRLETKLKERATALQAAMPIIRQQMQRELQDLYDAADFDFNADDVKLEWSFPPKGVVSDALRATCPVAYERELQRTKEFYESACQAREEEVAVGMYQMLDTLIFALEGKGKDKKRRIFKDTTVEKIFGALELAEQQRTELKIGNGPIKDAFDSLRNVLAGRRESLPEALRKGSDQFRKQVSAQLAAVGENLIGEAISPKRRVVLRKKTRSSMK